MKNFYEDNTEQKEIEDISSGRFDFDDGAGFVEKNVEMKSGKVEKPPHLPGVQPTVRFKNQTVQPQAPIPQSQAPIPQSQAPIPQSQAPVYGQYPPVYYQQPQGVPQQPYPYYQPPYPYYQQPYYGQPVQPGYAEYNPQQYAQQPAQQYPSQPYAQPNQATGSYPQGYYGVPVQYQPAPQQTQPQPAATNESKSSQPNPGTRVLFQSEDFERPVSRDKDDYSHSSASYAPSSITHEDVVIEEEVISLSPTRNTKPAPKVKRPPSPFTEDEMEIGSFELNAIALKHNSKATVIKHKSVQHIPDTSDVNVDEYESYFRQDEQEPVPDESKKKKKKKKASTGEIVRRIVLTVSIIAFIGAGGMLLYEYWLSKENDKVMQDVEDMIIDVTSAVELTTQESTTVGSSGSDNSETENKPVSTTKKQEVETTVLTEQQQWDQIKAQYPNVVFPMNLQLKYAKLYAENQDFAGYLSAEGIGLSLPVVHPQDEEGEKAYLQKNFYGKKTKYGCPFITHVNNLSPLDMNTVIFGHHMNNGTIFGTLDEYKTIEGFKKAPLISFNTLSEDYNWKVIAAFTTNALPEEDNGYVFKYYFSNLSTTERYASYLSELAQRSLYDTGVDVLPTDKLLTLSTCSHDFNESRFVVVARLVRPGESTEVDVSKASVNENPRYPQAYYDKKNKQNPYADAYRWEVG